MKRHFLILTAVLALAFGLIALSRRTSSDVSQGGDELADPHKQAIRNFWARFHEANTLRTQGNFAEAIPHYEECLRLNAGHEDSLYYLGTSLQELGQYAQAAASFRRLIHLNSQSSRGYSQLGNALSALAPGAETDFVQAREAYLRSIEINPEEAGPFLRLGLLELNRGRIVSAIEHFRIAAGFGSPEGKFWLGYAHYLGGKNKEAAGFFRDVLNLYAGERKAAARGMLSEGDLLPAAGKPLTPLEKTGLKSILFLDWASRRAGGYRSEVPAEVHLRERSDVPIAFERVRGRLGLKSTGGRGAWGDFDEDSRTDLVVAGLGESVVLLRNLGGKFEDVTEQANLARIQNVWDASWVDYDCDGDLDLYLIRAGFMGAGQNLLYRNERRGRFTDVTTATGLRGIRATARACFSDFDGDGRPDFVEVGAADSKYGPLRFFRNTGSGWVNETPQAGFGSHSTAVDCAVGDYDGDGRIDLFVVYWGAPPILYANLGEGRFADMTAQAGLTGLRARSFSAVFFDFDKDGLIDLLLSTQAPYEDSVRSLLQPNVRSVHDIPRLFRNAGNGRFTEVTERVGISRSYGTMQALAGDFDGDAWPDLLLVNGSLDAHRLEPSVILRNVEGKEFRLWSYLPEFSQPGNFIGAAIADFDGDGASDVYLAENPILRTRVNPGGVFMNIGSYRPSNAMARQSKVAKRGLTSPSILRRTD